MIFDLYLTIDFNSSESTFLNALRFTDEPFYKDIDGNEVSLHFDHGFASCLHRRNFKDSYAEMNGLKVWLFGYAYTNNECARSKIRTPWKLTAEEILRMFLSQPDSFVHSLKGSYVLVFWDGAQNTATVITDRLNVLPLYYAFSDGRLIVSSNTAMILKSPWVSSELDSVALSMQLLFDYMLGEHYFIKGIRRFENAGIYSFNEHGLSKTFYWDVSELYHDRLLPKKESLDLLAEQLKANVCLYAADAENVLVSLTGGFDGRTNVAMLDRPYDEFMCYSYGMPGSKQIRVPEEIARTLGINYMPIILEKEFLDAYDENTRRATYFSNGTAPVGFCNIPYAYQKLKHYSDTIITGLFGSEILRPLHNNGIQVNDQSFDIFLSDDCEIGMQRAIDRISAFSCYAHDHLHQSRSAVLDFLVENYFNKYCQFDNITRFFFFIIQEGLRKYFSQEISLERVYVTTRFPYFDTDLIDLIYQTPWAGMYNGFLGESKFKRRKGQLLYAHIIKKYKPGLGKIMLDRGYTPNDLLLPFPINFLKIGKRVSQAKKYMKKAGGNDTFKTATWADHTIENIIKSSNSVSRLLFGDQLLNAKKSNRHLDSFLTYRHMVSLQAFLNTAIQ